jgi:hypothetical protein
MRRRTAVLGGGVLVVVALVAATVVVVERRDERSVSKAASDEPGTTTVPSAAAASGTTTTTERPPLAILDHVLTPLPASGIGLVDGDQILLLNQRGEQLAWGPIGDARLVSPEDVAVASVRDGKVVLAADPTERSGRGDCLPGHAVGDRTVARCGSPSYSPPRIDVTDRGGSRTLIRTPPLLPGVDQVIGGWRSAKLSPDGITVLAQWSGECEVPIAYVIPSGGKPTRAIPAVESLALGWSRDGRAVVLLEEGACAEGDPRPGVYLITDDGQRTFVTAAADARYWSKG